MIAKIMNFLIGLVLLYLAVLALLYFSQRGLMYHPLTEEPAPQEFGLAQVFNVVETTTEDDIELTGWYHAAEEGMPTLLWFHGNAGHHGMRGEWAVPYIEAGYGVLLASYRGYAGNAGHPSEQGFYRDGESWMRFLFRDKQIDAQDIVLYGESIGSGVAVEMATRYDIGALVLQAPYSNIADVAQGLYPIFPVRYLLKDKFDSLGKIALVKAPLLILHGAKDSIIPPSSSQKLYSAALVQKKYVLIDEAGHNDINDFNTDEKVLRFFREISRKNPDDAPQ